MKIGYHIRIENTWGGNCILYLITIWLFKKTHLAFLTCFASFPIIILNISWTLRTSTVGKNPQLNVKGTVGVLTIPALRTDCAPRMLWWPFTPAVSEMHVFCADISLLLKVSAWYSDILMKVFGKYLEDFPVYHFVKKFILSFDVINLNFAIWTLPKIYVYYEICI